MLSIVNVSPDGSPMVGENDYAVRINHKVIGKFTHERSYEGASQCLREAADAVDEMSSKCKADLLEALSKAQWMIENER